MSHLSIKLAYLRFKQGRMSAGQLAWHACIDAGYPPPGTESPENRRECAARTAALARHSRKNSRNAR